MNPKHTIYVASSWRNEQQSHVVALLRSAGHVVYDFKNPAPGDTGFGWRQVTDKPTEDWTPSDLRKVLQHPVAKRGHGLDQGGMSRATACVLLLPCGSSAHLEAGWCAGRGIPTIVYAPTTIREPELMYLTFGEDPIITSESDLLLWIQSQPAHDSSCARTLRDAITSEQLAQIERDAEGFSGCFLVEPSERNGEMDLCYVEDVNEYGPDVVATEIQGRHIAEPIARMLNAVPALLAEVGRLRAIVDALSRLVQGEPTMKREQIFCLLADLREQAGLPRNT